MEYEMIEGKRKGSKVYCSNGYIYIKNNEYNGRMNLRCQFYRKKCPGTASIENGQLFENRSHCHDGDSNSIQKLKIGAKIKEDSEETPLALRDIFNNHVEDSNAQISPYPNLSSTMRKNLELKGFHSNVGKRMAQKRPIFWYFLTKLKSVAKAYHLETIQLGEGILTRQYKRQSSKRVDRYISKAEQKVEEGRYTSLEYSKVVAHVTEQSFDKSQSEEKENHDSENEETDVSPDEFNIGLDCDEMDLTDFTYCSFCENLKIELCATPCGHMLCTICIERLNCPKCHLSIISCFAKFWNKIWN